MRRAGFGRTVGWGWLALALLAAGCGEAASGEADGAKGDVDVAEDVAQGDASDADEDDGQADAAGDTAVGGDVPFVPDPETWGRGKVRLDEEKPAGAGPLMAGVAVRMIDGPVGVSMAGYGGRLNGRRTHWSDKLKGAAGFYGKQSVKAIAMEVGTERMAFVKSPLMCSESYLTDAIARHLKKDHGLDFAGRVITVAGHSHHATARYWPLPEHLGNAGIDSFDTEVAESIAAVFAEAIAEAWEAREPAEWAHGFQDDWDPADEVYRDRRGENNPTYGKDPRLSMLAFRRKADGAPMAVVMHFPLHGTVFGDGNDLFTEDAPGYVEHKFEEAFFAREGKPVFGMFAQSAGGDASPAGDSLGHPRLAQLERLGEAAAPKILALYDTLTWKSDAELAIRSQRIELVHERIYEGRPWADEFMDEFDVPFTFGGWQCVGVGVAKGGSSEGKPKLCVDLGWLIDVLEEPVPHNAVHQVYLTTARLGDVWMITMPGEPAWSIVKYAREAAAKKTWNGAPAQLMVLGYSQDHLLYLTAPDDWYLGGYESTMSLWGPGGAVFLADEGLAMMDAMMAGMNGPALFEESPSLAPVPPFVPRAREHSLAPGVVTVQPPATVARTQTVQLAANCGDPALGSPTVKVQRKEGDDFVDVPALHGWPGRAYDNSRYEMVSAYDPDPPQLAGATVAERTHLWRFYWQVPADWPADTYRLRLTCNVLPAGGGALETLTLDSTPFAVGAAEGATLTAEADGTTLTVAVHVPGVAQEMAKSPEPGLGEWASAGYRLLDRDVQHTATALVRADLTVEVLDASGEVVATVDAPFDAAVGANVATLPAAPEGEWSARAWLTADQTPAKVTATPASNP